MSKEKLEARSYNLKAKKSLGQNFLRDERIIAQIIDAVAPKEDELIVEVGPGQAALTDRLVSSGAEVVAVELDDRIVPMLRERFLGNGNFHVLHADVRRVYWEKELSGRSYRIVGNLPYYITSSIVRLFLEQEKQPDEMFYMVQKEVAERICSKPGDMSILSVAVQYYGVPEMLFDVPAEAFDPKPKVESSFMKITPKRSYDQVLDRKFFRVVRSGFSARRKTLANNLSSSLHIPHEAVISMLQSLDLDPKVRAQEVSVEEWIALVGSIES